jgi:outer membrane protein assembly factor BamA
LGIYNFSGKDSTKRINRMWRRVGEPPVIYSESLTEHSQQEIQQYVSNRGYMNATVEFEKTFKKKKANLTYTVKGNEPYRIRNVRYDIMHHNIRDFLYADTINSTIKTGALFDVDMLEAERDRMVKVLRNNGFYYFVRDYIYLEADTVNVHNHQVDITFRSRSMRQTLENKTVERMPHKRLKIRRVSFLAWNDIDKQMSEQLNDSTVYDGCTFYFDKKQKLKPNILAERNFITPDAYYSERNVEQSYAALGSLSIVRYVNITFREVEGDSLDCFILLTPGKLQGISAEIEGTNSISASSESGIGAAFSLTYQHRNLFRNAEVLGIKARTAYQPMGEISNLLSTYSLELGGEASLTFPKILFPFLSQDLRKRVRATTAFTVSYNMQTNPWYKRHIAGGGIKYSWLTGKNNTERYTISLVDINYVFLPDISDAFRNTYMNSSSVLQYSFEDHFIMSTGGSFWRTSRNPARQLQSFFTYRGALELAGNTLYGIYSLSNAKKVDGAYQIGGTHFAQYAKGEFEYSYSQGIDLRNRMVYRVMLGLAYPYGNNDVLPFEKRFYAGGANSVRGWSVRSLGPGVYQSATRSTDFMQTGDIKLDLNVEYRFKMFWVLEGAVFLDGGNVWTIRNYDSQKGGLFKFNEFYKQIALGYGLGLRFDFSFFIFRIDMGVQLYDPALASGTRWLAPKSWDNYAFHFAIGYPF